MHNISFSLTPPPLLRAGGKTVTRRLGRRASPAEFVALFCRAYGCAADVEVTRIEFRVAAA